MEKKIMILLINKNRLRNFKFGIQSYKGVKIGDKISVLDGYASIIITNFSKEHNLIMWTGITPMGNTLYGSSTYEDIVYHIKKYKEL